MSTLLLVEDDPPLGRALIAALRGAHYDVRWCRTGAEAIAAGDGGSRWDLVLLDLGLPDIDGTDVCRALRARLARAVIVILTARDAELDVVVGLEAGADDYLVKPVRSAELLARLRAHLRRPAASADEERVVGQLRVDPGTRRVRLGDHELTLRAKEFELLLRLARRPGAAVSREILMADVWDEHWFGSTKTLDVHVAGLRRQLGEAADAAGTAAPSITTLRGFGYRLEAPDGGEQPDG